MTHYAFATSLMNLMLVPTNMISGPLAEWLGFSSFFLVVMFASIPSAWAAFRAPFPLRDAEIKRQGEGANEVVITVDDPTVLTPQQREVQRLAGRASIYAMLQILTILLLDAKILGTLQGRAAGEGRTQFIFLLGSLALKIFLAERTLKHASTASVGSPGHRRSRLRAQCTQRARRHRDLRGRQHRDPRLCRARGVLKARDRHTISVVAVQLRWCQSHRTPSRARPRRSTSEVGQGPPDDRSDALIRVCR